METLDPCSLLVETQNSVSAIEKSIKIPQRIKRQYDPAVSPLRIYMKELKSGSQSC